MMAFLFFLTYLAGAVWFVTTIIVMSDFFGWEIKKPFRLAVVTIFWPAVVPISLLAVVLLQRIGH